MEEAKGYRALQDDEQLVAPAPSGSPTKLIVTGALVLLVMVAVLVVGVQATSAGRRAKEATAAPTQAASPQGQEPAAAGPGGTADEELGAPDAPIHVVAIPGHCEGHMKTSQMLRDMVKQYPKDLHVSFGQIGGTVGAQAGISCAGYGMKVKGQTPDKDATNGYQVLGLKSPGEEWTPETVEQKVKEALQTVGAAAPVAGSAKAGLGQADPGQGDPGKGTEESSSGTCSIQGKSSEPGASCDAHKPAKSGTAEPTAAL